MKPVILLLGLLVGAQDFQFVKRESGPVNHFRVVTENGETFLRSSYNPPDNTSVVAWQVPESERDHARKVKWTWRARVLPKGGDECTSGKEDSAAVVYLTWKRGLRWYTLKYVWSSVGNKGAVCDKRRNPFLAQDTIIRESGAGNGGWVTEELDLAAEFRRHFDSDMPAFVGIGLMSDGDQTNSPSSADFGAFTVER